MISVTGTLILHTAYKSISSWWRLLLYFEVHKLVSVTQMEVSKAIKPLLTANWKKWDSGSS